MGFFFLIFSIRMEGLPLLLCTSSKCSSSELRFCERVELALVCWRCFVPVGSFLCIFVLLKVG